MGTIKKPPPCVRFAAVFSSEDRFLSVAWERLQSHWGKIAALGPAVDFVESPYYLRTMLVHPQADGHRVLRKQMAIFADQYDPAELANDKLLSNRWEEDWTQQLTPQQSTPELQPAQPPKRLINIDPGYLSMTKLVLASTKNREHRLYLRDGIYAEVTLAFRDQSWMPMPWTYADYQRPDVLEFLLLARKGFTQAVANANRDSLWGPGPSQ